LQSQYTNNPSGRERERERRISIRNYVPRILGHLKSEMKNEGLSFSIPDLPKKKSIDIKSKPNYHQNLYSVSD